MKSIFYLFLSFLFISCRGDESYDFFKVDNDNQKTLLTQTVIDLKGLIPPVQDGTMGYIRSINYIAGQLFCIDIYSNDALDVYDAQTLENIGHLGTTSTGDAHFDSPRYFKVSYSDSSNIQVYDYPSKSIVHFSLDSMKFNGRTYLPNELGSAQSAIQISEGKIRVVDLDSRSDVVLVDDGLISHGSSSPVLTEIPWQRLKMPDLRYSYENKLLFGYKNLWNYIKLFDLSGVEMGRL